MRRVAVAAGWLLHCVVAAAEPTKLSIEGGAEADSNVARTESTPDTQPVSSAVARLGAAFNHRGKLGSGNYAVALSSLARVVTSPDAPDESALLTIGDLRWTGRVGERPVVVGAAVSGADALGFGTVGSRTFRSVGADAIIGLYGDDRAVTLSLGGRAFQYKPNPAFDWTAPAATVRIEATLWEPASGTRNLTLSSYAGVEARAYNSKAAANACADNEMPDDPRLCSAGTSIERRDRYQRLGVELTYTGQVVATTGYQLSVTDSNSYGQSLVRHRINVSVTTDLPWSLYISGLAILQLDQFLDGLIVQKDLVNQTFTTLDDENRSSLQVRLARPISRRVSVESRAAIWRDLGGNGAPFRRALGYLGIEYNL